MAPISSTGELGQLDAELLECLEAHVFAQMGKGAFVVIIHAGNSAYIRFMHSLISRFLSERRRVYVFDYHRRIKVLYLRQLLRKGNSNRVDTEKYLIMQVILDEAHALDELIRLQRHTPSTKRPPVLVMVDPSGLFRRQRGGVKQSAQTLEFQYEAAYLFAQKGFSVLLTDFSGRQFHRIESLVPSQLANSASLVLQFLPQRIVLSST